ncbi:hypothetical protein [Saliphagus sp. LR7]|uniref:DUF7269 family protein n=1 Tax=Saliphagus sp. LR7 TaxID=2282654 RepID=UPI001E331B48|nr:hypothetical protein [Saliphagus sp. LR7]
MGWPWADDTLLVGFFTAAFVIASLLAPFTFLSGGSAGKTTRPPERVPLTDTPGDDLMVLDRRLWLPIPRSRRRQVRSRLQHTAIRTLVRTADCSAADAKAQIEVGSWTDDRVAAGFVRSESESVLDHLLFPRRARRAAQAILEESETGADRQ